MNSSDNFVVGGINIQISNKNNCCNNGEISFGAADPAPFYKSFNWYLSYCCCIYDIMYNDYSYLNIIAIIIFGIIL